MLNLEKRGLQRNMIIVFKHVIEGPVEKGLDLVGLATDGRTKSCRWKLQRGKFVLDVIEKLPKTLKLLKNWISCLKIRWVPSHGSSRRCWTAIWLVCCSRDSLKNLHYILQSSHAIILCFSSISWANFLKYKTKTSLLPILLLAPQCFSDFQHHQMKMSSPKIAMVSF